MRNVVNLWIICLAFLLIPICGCRESSTSISPGLNGRLTLTGSSTLAPMISEIAQRFEQAHPEVRIDVQTGGSSRGIRDTQIGATDVGMASRALKSDELQGLQATTVAWDGVTFVVHRDNPIRSLSKQQLIDIYTGRILNWKQLGGNDAPIVVSSRAEGRSEQELMVRFLELDSTQVKADVIDGETQQSIKTVSTNVNAIVYTSIGAARFAADQGVPINVLPLEGVEATMENVQSGRFPLARPLILIQRTGDSNALADEFVRYAFSADVDDVTLGLGYVPPNRYTFVSAQSSTTPGE